MSPPCLASRTSRASRASRPCRWALGASLLALGPVGCGLFVDTQSFATLTPEAGALHDATRPRDDARDAMPRDDARDAMHASDARTPEDAGSTRDGGGSDDATPPHLDGQGSGDGSLVNLLENAGFSGPFCGLDWTAGTPSSDVPDGAAPHTSACGFCGSGNFAGFRYIPASPLLAEAGAAYVGETQILLEATDGGPDGATAYLIVDEGSCPEVPSNVQTTPGAWNTLITKAYPCDGGAMQPIDWHLYLSAPSPACFLVYGPSLSLLP